MLQPRDARPSSRLPILLAVIVLGLAFAVAGLLADVLLAPGAHPAGWERALLETSIVSGPVPPVVAGLAVAALAAVLVRRWRLRPALFVLGATALTGALAWVLLRLADAQDWFGVSLETSTQAWVIATFAGVGAALASVVGTRAWRRLLAPVAVLAVAAAGTVAVNADIGLQPTLADFAGITIARPLHLPLASGGRAATPATPSGSGRRGGESAALTTLEDDPTLWKDWHAPAGMPAVGTTGTVQIPVPASGFQARPAGIYLPPAALVPDAPALPLVVMMMGQPGDPDPAWAANALNPFAARHQGLAPIVVVADQLGGHKSVDDLCLDTAKFGKVQTYIADDVLTWARAHLHVMQDAAHTVVAGYSNGGECALSFGARFPALWSNVLDISGEAYAGSDVAAATLKNDFGGDAAAYRATWPATILAQTREAGEYGFFTAGSNDVFYRGQAKQMIAATTAAGWQTGYAEIPDGGHGAAALKGGLVDGFTALYPRLGLSAPGQTP